jgi:hypothetical protein
MKVLASDELFSHEFTNEVPFVWLSSWHFTCQLNMSASYIFSMKRLYLSSKMIHYGKD